MDLSIKPAAIDADDVEESARTIADLVLAAVRSAYQSAEELQQQTMGPFAAALNTGLPGVSGGLNLPGGIIPPSLSFGDDRET
jgi:DNA-binding protein YbaB